jgi:hypothetical protein
MTDDEAPETPRGATPGGMGAMPSRPSPREAAAKALSRGDVGAALYHLNG